MYAPTQIIALTPVAYTLGLWCGNSQSAPSESARQQTITGYGLPSLRNQGNAGTSTLYITAPKTAASIGYGVNSASPPPIKAIITMSSEEFCTPLPLAVVLASLMTDPLPTAP